jgi:hypothetical protein
MHEEIWKKIIILHVQSKSLILKAEEFDRDFKGFLQPFSEQRSALEHIIRARAAELSLINADISDSYVKDNLQKALGHAYRAFFDIADWLGLRIREKFIVLFSPYSNSTISEVAPQYYKTIRPQIEKISSRIAAIREKKDIDRNEDAVLQEVQDYKTVIEELLKDYLEMLPLVPALEEHKRKEDKKVSIERLWLLVIGIGCAAAGVFIGWLLL